MQLAIELIALEQWIESEQTTLQGAISTGNIWQFGQFERQTRVVTQDLALYRVPADLDDLLRILRESDRHSCKNPPHKTMEELYGRIRNKNTNLF